MAGRIICSICAVTLRGRYESTKHGQTKRAAVETRTWARRATHTRHPPPTVASYHHPYFPVKRVVTWPGLPYRQHTRDYAAVCSSDEPSWYSLWLLQINQTFQSSLKSRVGSAAEPEREMLMDSLVQYLLVDTMHDAHESLAPFDRAGKQSIMYRTGCAVSYALQDRFGLEALGCVVIYPGGWCAPRPRSSWLEARGSCRGDEVESISLWRPLYD
ncbi:hypothetical protein F4808DRAFT_445673 [Astrocystis sublimbata]|nr:hypothetical protein F4808DRAFT_445673 [Astrocystis sublimbata]